MSPETRTGAPEVWRAIHDTEKLAVHAALYTWPARQIQAGWVLDLGSEYGFGSLLITETNPELHTLGIDLDMAALRYSRTLPHNGRIWRVNANAFELPIASESLSGIYVISLLHMVETPCRVLFELWRSLKPGGIAIISIPWEELGESGLRNSHPLGQLALRIADLFSEVICPDQIHGELAGFPPELLALDQGASNWVAFCRKSDPAGAIGA